MLHLYFEQIPEGALLRLMETGFSALPFFFFFPQLNGLTGPNFNNDKRTQLFTYLVTRLNKW